MEVEYESSTTSKESIAIMTIKKYTIYNHTTIFAALIVEEFDFDYSEGCVHIASRTYNYKGVRR